MQRIKATNDAWSYGKHLSEQRVVTMEDRRVSGLLIGIEFNRLVYIRDGVLGSSSLMDTVDGGLVNRLENKHASRHCSFVRINTPLISLVRQLREQHR